MVFNSSPVTIVLILAIDLGTDLLPALGLGREKPEANVMKEPPRPRNERLLTRQLLTVSYGIVGVLQAAAGFVAFFFVLYAGGWVWGQQLAFNNPLYLEAVTAFFASIILCQIPDVLICRTRKQSIFKQGLFKNKLVWLGIIVELGLLAFIAYVPFGNTFFATAPIGWRVLIIPIPFMLLIFCFGEFRKWMIRKENKFFKNNLSW